MAGVTMGRDVNPTPNVDNVMPSSMYTLMAGVVVAHRTGHLRSLERGYRRQANRKVGSQYERMPATDVAKWAAIRGELRRRGVELPEPHVTPRRFRRRS